MPEFLLQFSHYCTLSSADQCPNTLSPYGFRDVTSFVEIENDNYIESIIEAIDNSAEVKSVCNECLPIDKGEHYRRQLERGICVDIPGILFS